MFVKLGILFVVLFISQTYGQSLAQIANNIKLTRHINATTIGPTAASYVSLALLQSDIVLENVTYTLTATELEVNAFVLVFGL
jgi:hypothetical protein